jgi:ubiquinone/menaquinone biosynthesis C-methylase UbiE
MSTTFDAEKFKATTKRQWDEAAAAWDGWGPTIDAWLETATDRMLELAGVGEGAQVLDVAAGSGGQTLAAARRTGSSGRVVATDISPVILEYAARAAATEGLSHVETHVADGESLGVEVGRFDAAISRVGLIYFPDQQQALAEIRGALREGGRFAAVVYSTPERNEFFSIPVSIIRRRAQLPAPAPGQPGPFSLGTPEVLEETLVRAGFRDIVVETVPSPLRLPSAAECVRFERESFGALHQMLSGVSEQERADAWAEIEAELGRFETPEGFVGPCEMLVAVGTK